MSTEGVLPMFGLSEIKVSRTDAQGHLVRAENKDNVSLISDGVGYLTSKNANEDPRNGDCFRQRDPHKRIMKRRGCGT